MSDIIVKPLEWQELRPTDDNGFAQDAYSPIGHYIATEDGWFLVGQTQWTDTYNLEHAKAAAQSDFDARIRSATERKAEPVCYVSQKSLDQLDADGSHVAVSTLIHKRPLRSGNGVALYSTPPAAAVAVGGQEAVSVEGSPLLEWAVDQWKSQVKHRPLVNVHRRSLDDVWRQVIRWAGGDPDKLVGPSHDELLAMESKR